MSQQITSDVIHSFKTQLESHPIYDSIATLDDLQRFMQHHVYSVWDFMSLIKYLQSIIAPTESPWVPRGDASVRRFINEIILEEESDESTSKGEYSSHFELYMTAMAEVGACTASLTEFIETVKQQGVNAALKLPGVPEPSRQFTSQTFALIEEGQPHKVAAAFALGREHIIPDMFRSILKRTGVSEAEAPVFHFYLNRHIDLDGDFHAPLSLRLLNGLCDGNETKIEEAIAAAQSAVQARLLLWDGVLASIQTPV
ncbi:DUF3050 domain-containing protein [Gimesia aquarii]|uniref:Heme oxygenase n=1 Tax=Gimesia aquarii TaxID=2527964 RepID=A0A517VSV9_9PLAN|nr:DUF3050 domain-containing protein [Gimesia aquarii]QDT96039.1 hypothetical protein V144x_14920 [Gimesia aquarii]